MTLKVSAGTGRESAWAKSSYSTDDGPACVEVAAFRDAVRVRDSKNEQGPVLGFSRAAWSDFLAHTTES
ncbi:DUF397 domain-containing protein [Streptomyces sp. NPDC003077]|uniref:DUF397 domain-containing protein n=1 Tax=Streptomyces sp. NPDC003077 TaxID=3154443 RepID=UPI0033A7AA42